MASVAVIKYLDVFEDGLSRVTQSFKICVMNEFFFQCMEETLGNSIIMTFSFSAHAAV